MKPNITIIDDSPVNIRILLQALKNDYKLTPFSSVLEAIEYFKTGDRTDLIMLDIDMPDINGYEAFMIIREQENVKDIPVIFVTARNDVESEITAFDLGIVDYIRKPIVPMIAKRRVDFHIERTTREKLIKEEARFIKKLSEVTIKTLVSLVGKFDDDSDGHINRVMRYVHVLATRLREKACYSDIINEEFIENLRLSAPFHDCGKALVSETILNKKGRLSDEEYKQIQKHTIDGSEIMKKAREMMGEPSFYDMAESLACFYHERWDGSGYPFGIAGENIPLCARIMAFADVYDALVKFRVYKEKSTHLEAVKIIYEDRGKAFDPVICDVFLEVADQFRQIAELDN